MSNFHPVYPKVSQQIATRHAQSSYSSKGPKLTNLKNVQALLEDRNEKAKTRHERPLCLEDAGGLSEAVNKLGDAIFFLFKSKEDSSRENKFDMTKKLILLRDLVCVLENMVSDYKS